MSTKKKSDGWDGVTVYTARSKPWVHNKQPIERMSLYGMIDDEPMGKGPRFPFRVVWRWAYHDGERAWHSSCRCAPYLPAPQFASDADAIAWLLEGEVVA